MPAATPAEVKVLPSCTKIASAERLCRGYRSARVALNFQWVVADLPARRPVAASPRAPVQMPAMRVDREASSATASSSCGSAKTVNAFSVPGTISVSRRPASATDVCTATWMPIELVTGCPVREMVTISYPGERWLASKNTSAGPTKSSIFTSSKSRMPTRGSRRVRSTEWCAWCLKLTFQDRVDLTHRERHVLLHAHLDHLLELVDTHELLVSSSASFRRPIPE